MPEQHIKIVKLITGESLVTNITASDKETVTLEKPVYFDGANNAFVMFEPLTGLSSFTFNIAHLVGVWDLAVPSLKAAYIDQFLTDEKDKVPEIITPDKNIILPTG